MGVSRKDSFCREEIRYIGPAASMSERLEWGKRGEQREIA